MNKWITALLQFKNTPKADGTSPAVKVFGHPLRDNMPAHRRSFAPEWQKIIADADEKSSIHSNEVEKRYNKTAQPLLSLSVGNKVVFQNDRTKRWTINRSIIKIGNHRDYFIATDGGRVLRRTRKFLRRRYPLVPIPKSASRTTFQIKRYHIHQMLQ
ncbi:hypothetical protein LOTGIDRAFT_153103 [Lottia gigantea]|uniref:Uncharacterized protein n=1 Tax=Lottia gigantea TaxID=225164 RepID=V3ZQH5_LOTGI|nr:hypothetical protein LOTGIDRAFT_153103 [Lottia gigantea]ESO93653.1 hypothetical protein LOTGIDRAFT_153103 [Lottia gigantea]